MTPAKEQEIKNSIEELSSYRDRLQAEVLNMSKKLRMSPKKIESTVSEHKELKQVDRILNQLQKQLQRGKEG